MPANHLLLLHVNGIEIEDQGHEVHAEEDQEELRENEVILDQDQGHQLIGHPHQQFPVSGNYFITTCKFNLI